MTDHHLQPFSHVTAVPIRVSDGWRGHLVLVHDGQAAIVQVPLVRDPGPDRPLSQVQAAFDANVKHLIAWLEQLTLTQRVQFHGLVTEFDDPYALVDLLRAGLPPSVTSARIITGYLVEVTFDTGETGRVDLSPYLWGSAFTPLRENYELFCQLRVDPDAGTITWPGDLDVSPEELHAALTRGPHLYAATVPATASEATLDLPESLTLGPGQRLRVADETGAVRDAVVTDLTGHRIRIAIRPPRPSQPPALLRWQGGRTARRGRASNPGAGCPSVRPAAPLRG